MKSTERQLKILNLLLKRDDYITAKEISLTYDVSTKTIYNDILSINELLKSSNLSIESLPRHGVKIIGSVEDKLAYLDHNFTAVSEVSSSSRIEQLMKLLVDQQKQLTYEYMSGIFYVSTSSIRNDIDKLMVFLSDTNAKLLSDARGTRVVASEIDIQNILKKYVIYNVYNNNITSKNNLVDYYLQRLINKEEVAVARDILNYVYGNNIISDYYKDNFSISLTILIHRLISGHHIDAANISKLDYMDLYLFAVEIVNAIRTKINIKFYDDDVKYLSSIMFAYGVRPKISKEIPKEHTNSVKLVINKMSSILNTNLNYDIKLYNSLMYHFTPMIYRLKNGISIRNPLLEDIKKEYSVIFRLTWYVMLDVEDEYKIEFNDDEISFIAIYFQIAMDRIDKIYNILIVCPIGFSTSELIYNKIKRIFNSSDIIRVISLKELEDINLDSIDIIVSSVKLNFNSFKIFYVSPLVTKEEMNAISNYYINLVGGGNINNTIDFSKQLSDVIQYFDSDLVYKNLTFDNKVDLIHFVSNELVKKEYVLASFEKNIIDREALGKTSLSTGVAIPHAMPQSVLLTKIVCVTLKNEINWDGQKVKLVILLAINEKDVCKVREMFTSIYSVVKTKEYVDAFISMVNNDLFDDK